MKKDYSVLLNQLDGNLASDVSTRCLLFVLSYNLFILEVRFNQPWPWRSGE